jgi:hypothetical protein
LVEKPEGKRSLEKKTRRWSGYNIKMDIKEMGWEGVDFIYVDQDRVT